MSSMFCQKELLPACVVVLVCSGAAHGQSTDAGAEKVHFQNSCAPDVQADFDHAVTFLHSFEYHETMRIFAEILERDPNCAMAHWGAAMSLWHPLWVPPSAADLAAGAATLEKTEGLAMTPRESAYIRALQAFFSSTDPNTHRERARDYEVAMSKVYSSHLDDPEAAVFYALSLLASADPKDKSYTYQFKAAGILNWVGTSQPRHPGVLHYLIHAYDYPELAHLALEAAKTYAKAAPDSSHAQHMPSHIFTRLGLWELSLASSYDSTRSAARYTEHAHLAGHYDEGLHSMDYQMYALLQTARDEEARELLDTLAKIEKTDTENFKVAYTYAASPARYALERGQWQEASRLELIRPDFPWAGFGWARSIHHFARGIGAARSGRLDQAREELAAIETVQRELPETTLPYWREQVQVQADAVHSWILLAEGKKAEAFELAAAAANREDSVDKHPVTPGEVLPARELYADMLLESGEPSRALEEYQMVMRRAPNRLKALVGGATAAAQAGDSPLAETYSRSAREQAQFGNQRQAGLSWSEARRGAE